MTLNTDDIDCDCDVAVIGAGPAGTIAARQLAQRGASVVLIDKARFPRDKVCGCCLSADALATLDRIGLGHLPDALGAPRLQQMELRTGGRRAHVDLPGGTALSRRALDHALVQAAASAGAQVFDGTKAELRSYQAGRYVIGMERAGDARSVRPRVVLAADGVNSQFLKGRPEFHTQVSRRSYLGIGTVVHQPQCSEYAPGVIHMAHAAGGYVGVVRLEDDALAIAAALSPLFVRHFGEASAAVRAVLDESGWPLPMGIADGDDAPWKGTALLTRRCRPVAHSRILLLGDAAGYVEPFTGEGMAWAMMCAEAVVEPALQLLSGMDNGNGNGKGKGERDWCRRYRRLIRYRQWRCRAIAAILRRPALMRASVAIANTVPSLTQSLAQHLTGPGSARHVKGRPI